MHLEVTKGGTQSRHLVPSSSKSWNLTTCCNITCILPHLSSWFLNQGYSGKSIKWVTFRSPFLWENITINIKASWVSMYRHPACLYYPDKHLLVLIRIVENDGHKSWMLLSHSSVKRVKSIGSINEYHSLSIIIIKSIPHCMNIGFTPRWLASTKLHRISSKLSIFNWNQNSLSNYMTYSSPIPIGQTPVFLSRTSNWQAIKGEIITKSTIIVHK